MWRALAVVVLAGCAHSVHVQMTKADWKSAPSSYVRVFASALNVPRPYDEIARLQIDDKAGSYTEMVAELREQAAEIGADALLLDDFVSADGHYEHLSARALTLYATKATAPIALARDPCAASNELYRFDRACRAGDVESCIGVGDAFLRGDKLARDPKRGADYFDEACEKGSAIGCTHYGLALYQGTGRPQSDSDAIVRFKRACDAKEMGGCRYLGVLYLSSINVEAIASYAEVFLQKACDGADSWSCWRLGKMLADGEHVAAQPDRAIALYARACSLGLEYACSLMLSSADARP